MEDDGDLHTLLSEQRRELMETMAVESDLETAFQLQMQEALNASLSLKPDVSLPDSSIPTVSDSGDNVTVSGLLDEEIAYYEQQILDQKEAAAEMMKIKRDLNRSIHDHAFARELDNVPEREWREIGDDIRKPYREESVFGGGVAVSHKDSFRVHVKGLIKKEVDGSSKKGALLAGIGVAICDMNDELVLEVNKGVSVGQISVEAAEAKAVIEGINVAIMLGINSIMIVSSSNLTVQCVLRKNRPKESNVSTLIDQIRVIAKKLKYCGVTCVPEKNLKFAFKLAQLALHSQARQALSNNNGKNVVETCAICLENISIDHMFQINGCLHRYCFSCMRTYVQVKLIQSTLPKCPHEGCKSKLNVNDCKKFLTPELFVTLNQRIMEASIDPAEKIYCPYPACSALMSRSEFAGVSSGIQTSARACTKCHRRFCIDCKVAWHDNMSCYKYKKLNPTPPEDSKLKSLATKSRWRQCPKCSQMVSLGEGCNHIYCRCGNEFCYVCGVEWKNKKATCRCPLWDERNIIYDDPNRRQRRRG